MTIHPDEVSYQLDLQAAAPIKSAFDSYQEEFKAITQRAKWRFENRDGHGAQSDAVERLELYKKIVDPIVAEIPRLMGDQARNVETWSEMKKIYTDLIEARLDSELAKTFFNSVTRRIFKTVGVNAQIEFIDSDFEVSPLKGDGRPDKPNYSTYLPEHPVGMEQTQRLVREILADYPFKAGYRDAAQDAGLAAAEMIDQLKRSWGSFDYERIELLQPVFYRNNGAFLIGRICGQATGSQAPRSAPLVFCLLSTPEGVSIDSVLMDEDEVSILFSFTRSYFHVEVEKPSELVAFLKTIIPLKRIAELYISIGYNKHGKTELYRDLHRHLANSSDQFQIARGEKGMVMVVFTLPSYDIVFKVIKDKVTPPKTASRKDVMERYDLVFKHDRAGRLVDAQEFEHLSFERSRFTEDLLAELLDKAPSMVSVEQDCVDIKHLYSERRMTPLNLYVKEAGAIAAYNAVVDYGQAIKDLAATNIFPGDVLLKNFGVTRHGRVISSDYDELCLLTDCKFRRMPQARNFDDEFAAEPWFYVGPMDIFPEEFHTFLGLQGSLHSAFLDAHADLFGVDFWRAMQARHRAGEVVDIFPYPESRRLRYRTRP